VAGRVGFDMDPDRTAVARAIEAPDLIADCERPNRSRLSAIALSADLVTRDCWLCFPHWVFQTRRSD